jgi:hypothetical protein
MSSSVTTLTVTVISTHTYTMLSATVGIVVLELLLALLFQKELLRVLGNPQHEVWLQALDILIVPSVLTFGLIVLVRFLNLLA